MKKSDVIQFFGGRQCDVVRRLHLSKGAVSQWDDIVPKSIATELHYLTEGQLRYEPKTYGSITRGELALSDE